MPYEVAQIRTRRARSRRLMAIVRAAGWMLFGAAILTGLVEAMR